MDANGAVDENQVHLVLATALQKVDSHYKDQITAKAILGVLKEQISNQDTDSTSLGVKRAISDALAVGVSGEIFSAHAVERLVGLNRKRLREPAGTNFQESMTKKRQKRSDAAPQRLLTSMKEFVYCHCKFLEKTFVCLHTRRSVWAMYNQFHDCEGSYFPDGHLSTLSRAKNHTVTHTHTPTGAPDWLRWHIGRLEAKNNDEEFGAPPPAAVSLDFWNKNWPDDVTKEKWRSSRSAKDQCPKAPTPEQYHRA